MSAYEKWREENPDWDKDWSQGCAGVGEVGEWQEKLVKKNPGWNDVLHKVSLEISLVLKCETFLCLIMPRKKKNGDQPIGVGLTSKQMKRKKPINADMLRDVEALTDNQKALFESLC